jgi:hypothetical protein
MPAIQFEEAVNRIMSKAGLDRGDAIAQLRSLRDDGTLDETAIPDLNHGLAYESMASMGTGFVKGAYDTAMTPVRKFADILGGKDSMAQFVPPSTESSEHEPAPVSEAAGSMAGAMPYFQTLGAATEGLPLIGGAGMFKQMLRGGLEGYPLSKMGLFGDMSTPAAMITGAVTPPVTSALMYPVKRALGSFSDMLAKSAAKKSAGTVPESVAKPVEEHVPASFTDLMRSVAGLPPEGEEAASGAPAEKEPTAHEQTLQAAEQERSQHYGAQPKPAQSANIGATFDIPPAEPKKPGYLMTADEKLKLKDREPIGTMTVREGEPFQSEFMRPVQSRGGSRVYYDYRNTEAASAQARALNIDNPHVIHVDTTGEEGLREAVRQAYPDSERVLDAIDNAQNPREAAIEALGRYARKNGHDAIVLNTPDPRENVILHYKNFTPSWQDDMAEPGWENKGPKKKVISADKPKVNAQVVKQQVEQDTQRVQAQAEFKENVQTSDPITHSENKRAVESPDMFDPEINHELDAAEPMRRKPAAWFRLPSNVSDHPGWKSYISDLFDMRRRMYGQVRRQFENSFRRIVGDMKPEEYDTLVQAIEGLQRDHETLELKQTRPDIDPAINEKAKRFRVGITDRMYQTITGNDPKTFAILEDHGLPHTRPQMERLRMLQNGTVLKNASTAEINAASRLKGMLNFDHTHDLDWKPIEGYFMHRPIDNERAYLEDLINKSQEYSKLGLQNQDTEFASKYAQDAVKRLKELDVELQAADTRRLPARDSFPRRHYAGPINQARDPKLASFKYKTDVPGVGSDYIQTALAKRYNDYMLARTKQLIASFPDMTPAMKDYVTTYVNTVRGARGFRGDALTADTINALGRAATRLTGKAFEPLDAGDIHHMVSAIMDFQFMSKLAITPLRFPIINLTHSITTTWSDVGSGIYAKALMRVLSDPESAVKCGMAAGIITDRSSFLDEVGSRVGTMPGPVRRVLGATSAFAEKLRYLVDYEAALEQYRRGEISPAVTTFVKEKAGRTELQAMREYARAHVDTLQFRQGIENKPLAFSGSSLSRLATQFRTWSVNLAAYTGNVIKSGDVARMARLGTALTFFGGLPVWVGGPTLFKVIRRELLKQGIDMPEQNGLQVLADQFGLQDSIGQVSLYSLQDPYSVDVAAKLALEKDPGGLLGPTFGSVIDLASSEYKNFMQKGSPSLAPVEQFISPQIRAALEASGELANGGVFGPDGTIEVNRPWAAGAIRGLDLSQSARSQRYNYIEDIAAAMESGNAELVRSLQKQAEANGIQVNKKFTEAVKSVAMRHKKAGKVSSWQELMGN